MSLHADERFERSTIDWSTVAEATYVIRQTFRYDYPGPILDLRHRLMVVPRDKHGDQRRIASRVDVTPHTTIDEAHDGFGNPIATYASRRVEASITFAHRSIVTRESGEDHFVSTALLEAGTYARETRLAACDATLRNVALELAASYRDPYELAVALNARVYADMRYEPNVTTVETTAAGAYAQRAGVCQDYAHVALAIARRAGLHARYVSGHMAGEGGTHAWIEALIPAGTRAAVVALDPTHGRFADLRYVTVAVGRDYADVAPTSGVFSARYNGALTATKHVALERVRYAAAPSANEAACTAAAS